jgi:HSP20 family protein
MTKQEKSVSVEMPEKAPPAEATRTLPSTFGQLEREMQRMFDSLWSRRWMRPFEVPELRLPFDEMAPKVDIIDRDEEVIVRAQLPGIDKNDIDVSLGDGTVTIKASTRREHKEEKGEYFRREISTGEYLRTVALPCGVDEGAAKATFENGVLDVTLRKAEQARRRQISIQ